MTEEMLETYKDDLQKCQDFIGRVIKKFGEEDFFKMVELFDGFVAAIEKEKKSFPASIINK